MQNPDNLAESDLWVSFQVQGEGLRNDVDFSAQPYLWLSAPKSRQGWQNDYQTLDGVFTPCGDTYRFGYNYVTYTETVCLAVDDLCDGPDGTPRGVVFRGPSSQVIGRNWTFSGRIRIEDGAGVSSSTGTAASDRCHLKRGRTRSRSAARATASTRVAAACRLTRALASRSRTAPR